MKAHELADALRALAATLKRGPNVEMNELDVLPGPKRKYSQPVPSHSMSNLREDLPLALALLFELSKFDKTQWVQLISEFSFDIEVGPRDSSRDLVGKVLRYLSERPEARNMLVRKVKSRETKGSPELARALSSLLGEP